MLDQAETLHVYPKQYEGRERHPLICAPAAVVEVIDHHLGDVDVGKSHGGQRAGLIRDDADSCRTLMVVIVAPPYAR